MNSNNPEDYSADELYAEIQRGGRIVVYMYCVSILVMTFKRGTRAYLIKGGHSRMVAGLPWTLLSLFLGWWGIPWGFIYTPEALYKNLSGGVDLTDGWLAQYNAAKAAASAPPPLDGAEQTASAGGASDGSHIPEPSAAASFHQEDVHTPLRKKGGGLVRLAAIAGVVVVIIVAICYIGARNVDVALINGLDKPYTIMLNDKAYEVAPGTEKTPATLITVPRGTYDVHAVLPGEVEVVFEITAEFGSSFLTRKVVIVNPDMLAIPYEERIVYGSTSTSKAAEKARYTVHPNKGVFELKKPDYFFKESPKTIRVKSTDSKVRTRVDALVAQTPSGAVSTIEEYSTPEEAIAYINRAGLLYPENTDVLYAVYGKMDNEQIRAFFEQHLDSTPVLVNWHRMYQEFMERRYPEHDLVAEYKARLQKDPTSGALLYLLGRKIEDHDEARQYYESSLRAPEPCAYAWNALSYEAMNMGDFEKALTCFDNALKGGVANAQVAEAKSDLYVAVGKKDAALNEIEKLCSASPHDFRLESKRQILLGLCNKPVVNAATLTNTYIKGLGQGLDEDAKVNIRSGLKALYAYGKGDEQTYVKEIGATKGWTIWEVNAAMTTGDFEKMQSLMKELESIDTSTYGLAYIVATQAGKTSVADEYWEKFLGELAKGDRDDRKIHSLVKVAGRPDVAQVRDIRLTPSTKALYYTVLGWKYPQDRDLYFGDARKMNYTPGFPTILLERSMKAAEKSGAM